MNPPSFRYNEMASSSAIPSLPSEPADRLYWLEGQLFVAMPFPRYQALMGSPPSNPTHSPFPSHESRRMSSQSSTVPCSSATTPALATGPSASPVEPYVGHDSSQARTRVPVACINCHGMRKSCDAERPCQRCIRRGMGASCVNHTRAARRRFNTQSSGNSPSALSPAGGSTMPLLGNEGAGGSGDHHAPLFPPHFPDFLLEETVATAAASNVNMNALWGPY